MADRVTARVGAVIAAAGVGRRLEISGAAGQPAALAHPAPAPKALREVAGRSLLSRAVESIAPAVCEVVVVAPADRVAEAEQELAGVNAGLRVVAGGATRQESVRLGLSEISPGIEFVLVHDAARPLVPLAVTQRVVEALRGGAAAVVPVIDIADSLRAVDADGRSEPVDRAGVRAVQTPQGFSKAVLVEAHDRAETVGATDDATLVERLGQQVSVVEGSALAFKITGPIDLALAEALLADQR
ncbi:MAG: 2-C-methyl-D-erythritol 4-phosphate cytidylyltransferase [Nocardioidaceae bacterium]|nr:2-C-methyl-D-erythritol 4-phosphate cytidylyltransferase [Nocardioidaceae bacterium]